MAFPSIDEYITQLRKNNNTEETLSRVRYFLQQLNYDPDALPDLPTWQARIAATDPAPTETPEARRDTLLFQWLVAEFTEALFGAEIGFPYYERGIKYAEDFLHDGERDPRVRERVLILYGYAGVTQGQLNGPEAEFALYTQGIEHAEAFLHDGERHPGVRELVLRLYFNAGVSRKDPNEAFSLYMQGIQHATAFLRDGERHPVVREQVLRLYVNAGVTQGQADPNDPQKAFALYREGLQHATAFLHDGERDPGVREQVLKLYVNAGLPKDSSTTQKRNLPYTWKASNTPLPSCTTVNATPACANRCCGCMMP